ncbi:hypothetical protein D7X87_00215 [bacterium D16-54]|nr:hypothetical protein D7X87_00215 [bacterium D16-54]RKJ16766.1 hypothetical protein D7X65_00215 [bacterium D16-56]
MWVRGQDGPRLTGKRRRQISFEQFLRRPLPAVIAGRGLFLVYREMQGNRRHSLLNSGKGSLNKKEGNFC